MRLVPSRVIMFPAAINTFDGQVSFEGHPGRNATLPVHLHSEATTTPKQAVAVALRTMLLVSLDDLLAVVRELLNPNASRSGLDRCLRRHGVGNLRDLKAKAPNPSTAPSKRMSPETSTST